MKRFQRIIALMCLTTLLCVFALAEDEELSLNDLTTQTLVPATPAPSAAPAPAAAPEPAPEADDLPGSETVPELIRQVLDIAHNEWATLEGKRLSQSNKYTWWRCGKGCKFGWCGGFITWCMLEAGVPMDELLKVPESVEGVYHVKEASVGKLLKGYQKIGRTTRIPEPGCLIIYAVRKSANKTIHVGLVYDVEDRGNGVYRLTTIEGNVSNRVKMYFYDYNSSEALATENMSPIPESDRLIEPNVYTTYKLHADNWYINTFLKPW